MTPIYKWSPFQFLNDRLKHIPISENDEVNFDNFKTCASLSSDLKLGRFTKYVNTRAFSKMPKKFQANAYSSFNGNKIYAKFPGVMKSTKNLSDENIHKVATIMNCTKQKAEIFIKDGLLDVDELVNYYDERYNRNL